MAGKERRVTFMSARKPSAVPKTAPVGKAGQKVLRVVTRLREIVRTAKNRIAEKKKRAGMRVSGLKAPKKPEARERKRCILGIGKNAARGPAMKTKRKAAMPRSRLEARKKSGKERPAAALWKGAPKRRKREPAAFRRRFPRRRSRRILGLISPEFFSPRRRRRNCAARIRNHF